MASVYTLEIRIDGVDAITPVLNKIEAAVNSSANNINQSLSAIQAQMMNLGATATGVAQNITNGLNQVQQSMQATSQASSRMAANVNSNLQSVGKSLHTVGNEVRPLGLALAGIGVGVGALGVVSVRTFADFEQAMANVRAVSGATEAEFSRLTDMALYMGETTKFTAMEAADGLTFMAMAGLKTQDMLAGLPSVLQLSAASGVKMGESADILTNIMAGMQVQSKDLVHVNDVLVKTFTNSNTNLISLGEAFAYASGQANTAGLSVEQTAAIFAAFAQSGIKGSRAGTTLGSMLREMAAPSQQAQKIMRRVGVTFKDAQGNMLPMTKIVDNMNAAFARIPGTADRLKVLETIFGEQGSRGMAALMAKGSAEVERFTRMLENSGGTAEMVAKIQLETLKGQLTLLLSVLERAGYAIGKTLAPAVGFLASVATKPVTVFNRLPEPLQKVITIAVSIVAVLALLAGGLLLVLGPLGLLLSGIAAIGTSGPVVIAMLGKIGVATLALIPKFVALAIAMWPITLVALAVGVAILFLFQVWRRNLGGIQEKTAKVVEFIKRNFDTLLLFLGPVGFLLVALKNLAGGWGELWAKIKDATMFFLGPIITTVKWLISAIKWLTDFGPVNKGGSPMGNGAVSLPALGTGGVVQRPTVALLGESGPEAVIPLSKMGANGTVIHQHFDFRGAVIREESDIDKLARRVRVAVEGAV